MNFREFLELTEQGTVGLNPLGGPTASGMLGMNPVGATAVRPQGMAVPPPSTITPGTKALPTPDASPLSPGVKANPFPQGSPLSPRGANYVLPKPPPSPLSPGTKSVVGNTKVKKVPSPTTGK
jgi:hypothetical protein